jgi:hypothetical protein
VAPTFTATARRLGIASAIWVAVLLRRAPAAPVRIEP